MITGSKYTIYCSCPSFYLNAAGLHLAHPSSLAKIKQISFQMGFPQNQPQRVEEDRRELPLVIELVSCERPRILY